MDDLAVGDRRFGRGDLRCIQLLVRRRRCRLRSRSPRRRRFLLRPTARSTFLADSAALRRCRRRLALAPRRVNVAFTCSLCVGAAAEVAATTLAAATAAAAAEKHEQLPLFYSGRSKEPAEGESSWASTGGGISG